MSRLTDMFIDIIENPFYFSEILKFASQNYTERDISIFEGYLIIAILMIKDTEKLFYNTNSRGTIEKNLVGRNGVGLILNDCISYNKDIMEKAILIWLSSDNISYNFESCNCKFNGKKIKENLLENEDKKIVKNIAKIFQKYKCKEVFNLLGVDNI